MDTEPSFFLSVQRQKFVVADMAESNVSHEYNKYINSKTIYNLWQTGNEKKINNNSKCSNWWQNVVTDKTANRFANT